MTDLRIILKYSVTRDDVDRCALQNNWEFYDVHQRLEKSPYMKVWVTPNRDVGIHYMEDYYIDVAYLIIRGENMKETAAIIHSSLDTYSVDELCQLVQTTLDHEDCMYFTLWLGAAGTTNYDQTIFNILNKQMYHNSPDIRKAAMFATTYLGWKEWNQPLENLINNDSDPDIRDYALITLNSLKKNYWFEKTE